MYATISRLMLHILQTACNKIVSCFRVMQAVYSLRFDIVYIVRERIVVVLERIVERDLRIRQRQAAFAVLVFRLLFVQAMQVGNRVSVTADSA